MTDNKAPKPVTVLNLDDLAAMERKLEAQFDANLDDIKNCCNRDRELPLLQQQTAITASLRNVREMTMLTYRTLVETAHLPTPAPTGKPS